MSLGKALEHLKHSRALFETLSAGVHLEASQNLVLWNALTGEYREHYAQLFSHLGQSLKIDPRGFAYFEIEDSDAKGTRPLALLYLLIFQKQADAGQDLVRFDQWVLDGKFLQDLREMNQDLLRSERLDSDDRWKTLLNKAVNLGFFAREGSSYVLLPSSWRFLDLFQELAQEHRASEESEEEVGDYEAGEGYVQDEEEEP